MSEQEERETKEEGETARRMAGGDGGVGGATETEGRRVLGLVARL